ncbi:dethiobiotin synthase [Modicisalibacter xianhensis]|uniref:ATP-dependent dethiobiotin synthetase BioD n=1 Tax=Modicisalibacter xianhensis TaxID=442341 RepID=A0A1I3BQM5_9GAMM|nr:dethiobiotin synthase [Halomonas xianhensis]SFH64543.1 dethiobiotin synthetase [Halomonas xianhensis]
MSRYFVTGTDTDAGKTFVSAALLASARRQGRTTLGLKPVAAGCERVGGMLRNIDALLLQAQSFPPVDYATVNPVALEPAIAPHLAAQRAGVQVCLDDLERMLQRILDARPEDTILIEGAGGWRVPLNAEEDLSGLAVRLELPVILVVGMRLGCISHARLTLEAIRAEGLRVTGWVANQIDPNMREYEANLETLHRCLDAPFLGAIPWLGDTSAESSNLSELQAKAAQAAEYLSGL